jgi:3-methyladenine DNA glycosylase AlkD
MTTKHIIQQLKAMGDEDLIAFKHNKYAITTTNALGISMKDLKAFAKQIKYNKELALELYDTGIYEAKILCAIILKPSDVTVPLAKKWIAHFDNWEICDTYCMQLIAKSDIAIKVIELYKDAKDEYQRRASFAVMAAFASHRTQVNSTYESFLPYIVTAATDQRNFVKKAVNWALRSIGKRNVDLKIKAIEVAQIILQSNNKTATWIAKDALKELQLPTVRVSDYPRHIYRQ